MGPMDFKLLKKKEIDKGVTLKVTKNIMSNRIFVEFISESPKLTLQKNFQDSLYGKIESEKFVKSISSLEDLLAYFRVK